MPTMKHVTGDLFGGLTAAIVALPLALAFGVQSGMGAIAGLYGAIALGFFAALFGGTATQISGPTGPMTVVSATIIAGEIALHGGSIDAAFGSIIATFVLAGVFLILMGVFRIGEFIRYMPYPVVSGFMSGIGLIIIIMQIFPFFGMNSTGGINDIFLNLGLILSGFNVQAMILSASTLAIIYLFPKLTKKVPSTLVALILVSVISTLMGLKVPIIGDIPKGLPDVHIDTILGLDWQYLMAIIVPAITLAALGAIDSLLTSVVADNMTKTHHNPNKELIGQGIGNMASGFIGGLPGAGATMRTVVNINAGGKTNLSGMFHALVLLVILLGAGAYAKLIPLPVLAGILISVGIGIVDYKGLKHIMHVPKGDAAVMIVVVTLTVFVDLLQAVGVGLVMAALLFMKQMSDVVQSKALSKSLKDYHEEHLKDTSQLPDEIRNKTYIYHFDGPIFFGFVDYLKKMIKVHTGVEFVIFEMENVPMLDQSGIYAIEEAVLSLEKQGIDIWFVGLKAQPKDMLRKIRLIPELVEEDQCFETLDDAINALATQKI